MAASAVIPPAFSSLRPSRSRTEFRKTEFAMDGQISGFGFSEANA
jgi:hypothetical protein